MLLFFFFSFRIAPLWLQRWDKVAVHACMSRNELKKGVVYERKKMARVKKHFIKGDSRSCLGSMLKTEQAWIFPVSSHFQRDIIMTSKTVMKEGGRGRDRRENRTKAPLNYNKPVDCVFLLDCVTILSCQFHYTKGSDNRGRNVLYNMPDRVS